MILQKATILNLQDELDNFVQLKKDVAVVFCTAFKTVKIMLLLEQLVTDGLNQNGTSIQKEDCIDKRYYQKLVDDAIEAIDKYGDANCFMCVDGNCDSDIIA